MTGGGSLHQRCVAVFVVIFNVGVGLEEYAYNLRVAGGTGIHQGGVTGGRLGIDICAVAD